MKTKFLIIGLTGPLGSGCETVSKFLSSGLEYYSNEVNNKLLPSIDEQIGKYSRFIRQQQTTQDIQTMDISEKMEMLYIDPKMLVDSLNTYEQIYNNLELRKKDLNRRLRNYLQTRDYLKTFISIKWPSFTVISMSDLILKLVIKSLRDDKGQFKEINMSTIFSKEAQAEIYQFAKEYADQIDNYDNRINPKAFEVPSEEDCREFDNMFLSIKNFKERLKKTNSSYKEQWLQDIGDNLRATGNAFTNMDEENSKRKGKVNSNYLDIIAQEANKYIKYTRRRKDQKKSNFFVIESFRNPAEIDFFRKRYGSFFAISIYANKELRRERREKIGLKLLDIRDKRDQGKENSTVEIHKQNVSGCVLLSDYAINNEYDLNRLQLKVVRLLSLIERPGCTFPSTEETFMNLAYSLSVRSTCISRQVGAVITNSEGFVIGAGWNDVGSGQLGCAVKCIEDFVRLSGQEHLLSIWRYPFEEFKKHGLLEKFADDDCLCFKDLQSELKISKKIDEIALNYLKNISGAEKEKEKVIKFLDEFKVFLKEAFSIKRLEYARALHAEENAILQVATNGGMGILGGTIYTTTFPCELCAKKIYQSGIKRVVFTEPYPDSISEAIFLKDGIRSISVEQFEGIKSSSFYRLFKSSIDRKESQLIEKNFK